MKNHIYFLLQLLFLTTIFSCTSKNNFDNEIKLSLVKQDSITLAESIPLFGTFYERFKISADGQHWIFADKMLDKIFVYAKNGSFKTVIGKNGRGPLGIVGVNGFDINEENQIFIYDASQRMLKIFDLKGNIIHSGKFLEKAPFGTTPLGMEWYKDKIVVSIIEREYITEPEKSRILAQLEITGRIDTLFGKGDIYSKKDNDYTFTNEIKVDQETDIIYANLQSSPFIQTYSATTHQRKNYIGKKTDSFQNPEREIKLGMSISEINERATNNSVITGIYLTDKYIIQHMQILTKEFFDMADYSLKKNVLVIYDKETHHLVNEMQIDGALGAVYKNKLYLIEDFNPENYTIGIYEFKTEKI